MSSLAVSLALLVVLALVVAVVYNLRQSRTHLRWPAWLRLPSAPGAGSAKPTEPAERAARKGSAAAAPAATGGPRGEPRLATTEGAGQAADVASGPTAPGPSSARIASPGEDPHPLQAVAVEAEGGTAGAAVARDDARAGAAPEAQGHVLLSELCDCIVEIAPPSIWSGERLIGLAQRFRRAGAKPVLIEGLPADAADGQWSALAPSREYRALRAGILLANRHGPLNAMEYSEFVAGVQAIADALSALADTPDMAAVLARARDMDATCAQLDAQIGLNVEAPEALGPAQLAALAGPLSVVERGSNRYARLGPQGEVVFSVALGDVPNRLTFLLDVPRSSPSSDAWSRMVQTASACAQRLGGRLVDDGGRPLADSSLTQIGRQLLQRYESLDAIGIPAGSALALRVFN